MLLESILKKIFGDPNAKELKNIQVIVDKINALEPEMQALSSANLAAKTGEFKLRLAKGETLDDILPHLPLCAKLRAALPACAILMYSL